MAEILLVDDDTLILNMLACALQDFGYTVRVASNGAEGLAKFHDSHPDLVITDIVMPDGEGVAMIRAMLDAVPTLPIIAMSGAAANLLYLRTAVRFGAITALTKPISLDELRAVVGGVLAAPRPPGAAHKVVLVVGEEAGACRAIAGALRSEGLTVLERATGAEALELLKSPQQVDILFTNVILPGEMNGFRLGEQAKRLRPNLPVIYSNGHVRPAFAATKERTETSKASRAQDLISEINRALGLDLTGSGNIP